MFKKTSHTTKKHKRRKPIEGLTPADVVRQMAEEASGKGVRKVRRGTGGPDEQVLSAAREGSPDPAGRGGIFGKPSPDDNGRAGDGDEASVPDAARVAPESAATQLSRVLKRMLGEQPPADLIAEMGGQVGAACNAEMLAGVIMREALAGKQWAVEMVRDQTEGKPVRAAQVNNSEGEVEDMLDRVSTNQLNSIAKGSK